MAYKTIVVCLSNKEEAERLVPVASMLARQFDAHLLGIHSLQSMEMYANVSMQLSGSAIAELQTIAQKHASEVKDVFEKLTQPESFVSEWRQIETSTAATGELLAEQARCADLVVMAQIDPDHSQPGPASVQRHLIEHSGRPVLVIPRFGSFEHIGKRPLIGWSGTGECARAVHDAIPFFQQSEETRVFWINSNDKAANANRQQSGQEIATALDRHGVTTTVANRVKSAIPIGDELLNEAADSDADLIVTGAYGHSRLYDFVIGATTTHLLRFMTTPVLFSQ